MPLKAAGKRPRASTPVDESRAKKPRFEEVAKGNVTIHAKYGGRPAVRGMNRGSVLILLKNMPDGAFANRAGDPFATLLNKALAEADTPEGLVRLSAAEYDLNDSRIFTNTDGADFVNVLLDLVQYLRPQAEELAKLRPELDEMKVYKQGVREITEDIVSTMSHPATPAEQSLIREQFWEMVTRWMDCRFRAVHSYGRHVNPDQVVHLNIALPWDFNADQARYEPAEKIALINGLVHGGNLRHDTLMCEVDFAGKRYDGKGTNGEFRSYLRQAFQFMYRMTSEQAGWLIRQPPLPTKPEPHPDSIDYPAIIALIDRYVTLHDDLTQKKSCKSDQAAPQWEAFTDHLRHIASAGLAGTTFPAGVGATLRQLSEDLINRCDKQYNKEWARYPAKLSWNATDHLQKTYPGQKVVYTHKYTTRRQTIKDK